MLTPSLSLGSFTADMFRLLLEYGRLLSETERQPVGTGLD